MNNSITSSTNLKVKLAEALQEKASRIEINPIKYSVQHPKQIEASQSRAKIRALFWGNRVGKTEWGAQEVAKVLLGEHKWISPGEIWSFSTSFDDQKDTTQKKLLSYLPKHRWVGEPVWLRRGIIKEITIDAGNGRQSKVTFKSYEQGREKAQGAGKVLIWFDEEPPQDIWEECLVRQDAGIPLHIILTMTPVKGMTWVYDDIYMATNNSDIFVSAAGWDDNPYLTEEQKNQMSRGLKPSAIKVRREGKFIKKTGLVCSWFSRSVHIVKMDNIPDGTTYFGLDFGFTNPAAGLWVRMDRDFNLWIFDGFYRRGLINTELQKLIQIKEGGIRGMTRRVGDSAQASDIKQLNDSGIEIVGVKKETGTNKENWDEWRARIMEEQGRVQELTGKPKLFISADLVEVDDDERSATFGSTFNFLMREMENLSWEERKESGEVAKAMWGNQPNHGIDALTYILAEIYQPKDKPSKTKTIRPNWTGFNRR